ncbi:MAG TPA: M20/M25/M40 family metallo-hydrolase [Solirubrobacteraceae bacterium]|nr:M20/M25/M40 family metallo-hydrolase [Solirubrobacteraceae bacterium]
MCALVTELLQDLIRFDTVNPPGNERAAQEHLAEVLDEAGFAVHLLGAEAERPNLVAHLEGRDEGPTLGFLGHVDTVLADPTAWSRDPWSGDLADGFVWGRGALDMKSQVAAEVAAAVGLARDGWRPARGELKIISVVDEETGGALGARWLCRHHRDTARCDFLLNEGGGMVIEYRDRRYYGVCCAEKGVFRFTVTTSGAAGHASVPMLGDNALLKMAPVLERMRAQPPFDLTDEPRAVLRALGGEVDGDAARALQEVNQHHPGLAVLVQSMLGISVTPTRISASEKVNVIPASAQLKVDCRVPAGLDEEHVLRRVRGLLGDGAYELEFDERAPGNRSPMESALMDRIAAWIEREDPGGVALPTQLPAFTDSRHFRAAFPECVAYGFFPMRHQGFFESWPLIHGADERIDVRDLEWATTFYADVARGMLGG